MIRHVRLPVHTSDDGLCCLSSCPRFVRHKDTGAVACRTFGKLLETCGGIHRHTQCEAQGLEYEAALREVWDEGRSQ